MRRVFGFLLRPFLKIPLVRRAYLKRLLTYLEETPTSKLPAELRAAKSMLERLPKQQRLAALESGLDQAPQAAQQPPPSRAMRRAAEKEQRRRR